MIWTPRKSLVLPERFGALDAAARSQIYRLEYGKPIPHGLPVPSWFPRPPSRLRQKQSGMLWVPQKGPVLVEHNTGTVGTITPGASVTTGASASTKGTVVQLFAATSFDAYWVTVMACNYAASATASAGAMALLIGDATEDVLVSDMLFGYTGTFAAPLKGPKIWEFPLYVPAGSRLAVQAAGERVSTVFRVAIYLYGGNGLTPGRVGQKCTTYGMGTVPNGTSITMGASGAEGAYAQISAASSEDHFAFTPSFQLSADTSVANAGIAVDIGVGAATEEEIAQSYWFVTDTGEGMGGPFPSMPCFRDVPSGTRLTMRASSSAAADTCNGVIHAMS